MKRRRQYLKLTSIPFTLAITHLGAALAIAGMGDQLELLLANDGVAGDEFGVAVGISGNTAIVGAKEHSNTGEFSGAAYLFDITTGLQLFELIPTDSAEFDHFGNDAAIDGKIAIVGSQFNDDNGVSSGSAYLFDAQTGCQLFKLLPNDGAAGDNFGSDVSIHGNIAIVGAQTDDDDTFGESAGSAYLFDVATGSQLFKLLPNDGQTMDFFGGSVAISGNTAVVGSSFDDDNDPASGSAYVFEVSTGQQLFKLLPDDGSMNDIFGSAVAIHGNIVAVGAPRNSALGSFSGAVYLFDSTTGAQLHKLVPDDGQAFDRFGSSVSISGNIIIVGAADNDANGAATGAAYLFDATTGQQLMRIHPDNPAMATRFGVSVGINGDTAVVGANFGMNTNMIRTGTAHVFGVAHCSPADLNNDNAVDTADLGILIGQFGTAGPEADVNGDGVVDTADLGILISVFGTPCF